MRSRTNVGLTRTPRPTCGEWHRNWTDASISGLAAYFSKQTPVEGRSGNAALIAQGKKLFAEGRAELGRFRRAPLVTAQKPKATDLFRAWPGNMPPIYSSSFW